MFLLQKCKLSCFFFCGKQAKVSFLIVYKRKFDCPLIIVIKLPDKPTWSKDPLAMGHWSLWVGTFGPLFQQFLKCNHSEVISREIDFLLKICWSIPCLHPSWKVDTCPPYVSHRSASEEERFSNVLFSKPWNTYPAFLSHAL